jgi:hypothetical protein
MSARSLAGGPPLMIFACTIPNVLVMPARSKARATPAESLHTSGWDCACTLVIH